MSEMSPTRREVLAASAAVGAASVAAERFTSAAEGSAIRPFNFNAPDADLLDPRRRIAATRWPDKEQVTDESQGVRVATMRSLAQY
jgi:hypothetical protein